MPTLLDTRFGRIEYEETEVMTFEEGLIGFPRYTRFLIVAANPVSPFRWLQSVEEGCLAFLVVDPTPYVKDYGPVMVGQTAAKMQITKKTPTLLLTTASIPKGRPKGMTVNLAGPIVINMLTRKGRQFVIDDPAYTIKHRVFQTAGDRDERVAA